MSATAIFNYVKDRVTKKELSTAAGVILLAAGPAGWMTADQIAGLKTALTAFGLFHDPGTGAAVLSTLGAALFAAKEKS